MGWLAGSPSTAHKAITKNGDKAELRWVEGGVERGGVLLGGGLEVLNAAVDEGSQRSGRFLDGVGLLGDGELRHELVENLDALGVLGGGLGGGGRHYV